MSSEKYCSTCNKENHCAIANNSNPSECWCMNVEVPREAIKAKLAAAKNVHQCLCRTCLTTTEASTNKKELFYHA
ncbi:hypothetical protein SOPP22_16620 [Shewanella sp. OPT22]|nr:hypothetical protein SOPP22_16620 [Shewanella sp. OPT22]